MTRWHILVVQEASRFRVCGYNDSSLRGLNALCSYCREKGLEGLISNASSVSIEGSRVGVREKVNGNFHFSLYLLPCILFFITDIYSTECCKHIFKDPIEIIQSHEAKGCLDIALQRRVWPELTVFGSPTRALGVS